MVHGRRYTMADGDSIGRLNVLLRSSTRLASGRSRIGLFLPPSLHWTDLNGHLIEPTWSLRYTRVLPI